MRGFKEPDLEAIRGETLSRVKEPDKENPSSMMMKEKGGADNEPSFRTMVMIEHH